MKCNFEIKREIVNGQRTNKVNVFIELLSCDRIDENMITSIVGFYNAYIEKHPDQHFYPDRVKSFHNEIMKKSVAASRKFYESPEEQGDSVNELHEEFAS
jgi:hypothetical protein